MCIRDSLYDGLNPVQELNGSNGIVANLLTGLRVDEYFTRTDTATSTFLTDALGSTVGLVGSSGTIATNYTYQPFGGTTAGGSANGSSYQFTGRENDGTGLYFYRARYYSPTFQRFIAQDPIGLGGGDRNPYGYALDDPTTLEDALGTTVFSTGGGKQFDFADNDIVYSLIRAAFQYATPVGSALKSDAYTRAAAFERAGAIEGGTFFLTPSKDLVGRSLLLQKEGCVNGKNGVFEYIVPINAHLLEGNPDLTHQKFIPGGTISGVPNNFGGQIAPPFLEPGEL